jgi:hypothetical protein
MNAGRKRVVEREGPGERGGEKKLGAMVCLAASLPRSARAEEPRPLPPAQTDQTIDLSDAPSAQTEGAASLTDDSFITPGLPSISPELPFMLPELPFMLPELSFMLPDAPFISPNHSIRKM